MYGNNHSYNKFQQNLLKNKEDINDIYAIKAYLRKNFNIYFVRIIN